MNNHLEEIDLFVTRIKSFDLVLGMTWLVRHNPEIDFRKKIVKFHGSPDNIVEDNRQPDTLIGACAYQIPDDYTDFADVFDAKQASKLPQHGVHDCAIILKDPTCKLPAPRMYKLTEHERTELRHYLDENLAKGYIRPSTSPAGSPILFVRKKDGTLQPVVDFRGMNKLTKKNEAPLPLISDLFSAVGKARWFTMIDLRNAYNLVRIRAGDEYLTAFKTPWGLFEYCVMPFGHSNAPAVFQGLINEMFYDVLDRYVVAFLDDILIFSTDKESHRNHVQEVLKRQREHGLYAKPEKCKFNQVQVEFLGFIISRSGIQIAFDKTKAVVDWPRPTTRKELQRFLGLANYLREFIKGCSEIAKPLTDLTSPMRLFCWNSPEEASFQQLKRALISAPVLCHTDSKKPFIVKPDASNFAVGAVLLQQKDQTVHPVAYH